MKGQTCTDNGKQFDFTIKEDSESPTVSMEAVPLTAMMEAREQRKVGSHDTPNAFVQTHLENEEERIVLVLHGTVVNLMCDTAPFYKEFLVMEKD